MSLYSDALMAAADTQDIQAGGPGFLADLSNNLTAGAAGAVISGLGSIYNTAADGVNMLGANMERIDTYKKLQEIDLGWAEFYKRNETPIDVVGFIGSSLIPGTLAIKGLNAVRAGASGNALGRALGFARTKQAESLSAAVAELSAEGGTIYSRINKAKWSAMGWGFADQTITAAAFETGVALTMKSSPLLADDSWWDIGKSALVGAAFGGVIGGSIDSLILNRGFKNAVKAIDEKQRGYDYQQVLDKLNLSGGDKAFGVVDSLLRLPDDVLENDKVQQFVFQTASGPTTIAGNTENYLRGILGKSKDKGLLDFEAGIRALAPGDAATAEATAGAILREYAQLKAAGASPAVIRERMGDVLYELKSVKNATEPNFTPATDLWYFNKSITPEKLGEIKTVDDWKDAFLSNTPFEKNAYNRPYVFKGTPQQQQEAFSRAAFIGREGEREITAAIRTSDGKIYTAKEGSTHLHVLSQNTVPNLGREAGFIDKAGKFITREEAEKLVGTGDAATYNRSAKVKYRTLEEAWKDGRDVAFLPDGTVRVNDASKLWQRVDDAVYNSTRYWNTRSGAITEDAVLTAADRLPAGASMAAAIKPDAVYLSSGVGKNVTSKTISMVRFRADGDAEYYTARHAWASQLKDAQLPKTIQATDFSLMDRLRDAAPEALEGIIIKSGENVIGKASDISIPAAIKSSKLSTAQDILAAAYEKGTTVDVRELAYRLNVEAVWLENAVASRFRDSLAGTFQDAGKTIDNMEGLSRPLSDYLQRETVLAEYARPQQFKELQTLTADMTWKQKRDAIIEATKNNGGQFVTGELAWHDRVQTAIAATKNAAGAVLGTARLEQLLDLAQDAAKLADSTGVGASFLASSNANYGEILKLWSQNTGKNVHLWIAEDLKQVVDAFSTVSNRLRADPTAAAELGIVTNMLRATGDKYIWAGDQQLMLRELKGLTGQKLQDTIDASVSGGKKAYINIDSPLAAEFLRTHSTLNGERIGKRTVLVNSRGMTSNLDSEVVYAPPIDTTYFKHFAFVRPVEGKAFGTSEVSMVFGRDAAELSKRIHMVDAKNFDVITKGDTEKWFKAKGDYDFDLTINEPRINSELHKSGVLNNAFPEMRAENLVEDYLRWHQNQTSRLVRDAVETNYAQQIAELRKLGESYVEVATSRFAGTSRSAKSEVINPYDDYVKTALDVSKRSEYTFFHQANEFVDALGTRAYQIAQSLFGDAKKGIVSYQEANAQMEKHGIRGLYQSDNDFFTANVPRDRNLAKEYVAKANALLANFTLRFDFANSLLNTISTPILLGTEMASIRNLIKNDPALVGKLSELTNIKVPGQELSVPTTSKLVFKAVANFLGKDKDELLVRYKANGDIKDILSQYHSAIDDLAMRADFVAFKGGVDRAFEKMATITGNNWSEQFTRFVSADVMRQLSDPLVEAGKMTLKEQNAYISTFVNRVQGNYISSQRPIVFQGVLGSAVGLFQTYSFNLLQQLLRHVENRDKKAVATMFGLQAGLFGLNGTPLFEAVNTHLIGNAAINDGHYDAYSVAPALGKAIGGDIGKQVSDWMMYGTASAFPAFGDKWPALYTRGDINPRHISILPLNPLDVPAIDASIRVAKNIADVGRKLVGGADVSQTLLQGLEHNGVNRPLAGFAQAVAGQATTSKGSLISAASDFSLVATAARLAGSRPMDESIALNGLFRNEAYKAADRERTEILGEKVKSYLYKNQFPPDEVMDGFMKDYASAGGRVENFNRSMQIWAKDANVSVVEKMRTKMNSSWGQRFNELVGGEPLSDYRNQAGQSELLVPE